MDIRYVPREEFLAMAGWWCAVAALVAAAGWALRLAWLEFRQAGRDRAARLDYRPDRSKWGR